MISPPFLVRTAVPPLLLLAGVLVVAGVGHADASAPGSSRLIVQERSPAGLVHMDTLPPGSGLVRATGNGRVLFSRAVDPGAPARVIVELDPEPAATAPRFGLDPGLPRRRLEQLRADLSRLAMAQVGGAAARITREYTQVFSGAAVTLPPGLVPALRSLPYVRDVFPDDSVHATLDQSVPLIRADEVRNELGGTGAGIRVGIVDTGIDYDHPAFGGGFGPGHRVAGGWDFINDDADPRDDNGHGTHVAGIVAGNGGGVFGVATRATLYAFKVLDAGGSGLFSTVLAGLDRVLDPDGNPVTDDALQVINLSLGSQGGDADDPLSQAIDHLSEAGVVCVVAAGNSPWYFSIGSPGTSRRAITVGASTKEDALASFSSLGPAPVDLDLKPDLLAPGQYIVSAALGGGRVPMSGTSMATPHVAGVAAQLRQLHPDWTVDQVKASLVGTARDLLLPAFQQGAGRVDAYAAATATFAVEPTHLAYGRIDASVSSWTHRDTLHVSNLTDSERTVSFPAATTITTGATLTLTPSTVTLPPHAAADVVADVAVDNALVPYPPARPFGYDRVLLAISGSEVHRVPVSFHKCASVRVRSSTPPDFVLVHDRRPDGFVANDDRSERGDPVLVAPGMYDVVVGYFMYSRALVFRENVPVAGDVDLLVDPSEAAVSLDFENVDERGQPVACNFGSFGLAHREAKVSFGYAGWPFDQVRVSPVSAAYSLLWLRTATDNRNWRRTFSGALAGATVSQTLTNRPEDLRHLRWEVPAPPLSSARPLFWDYQRLGDDFIWGLAMIDTTVAPITGPFASDWWFMLPPDGRAQLGGAMWLLTWKPDWSSSDSIGLISPCLELDRGWPIEGHIESFFEPVAFRFGAEHLVLGAGLPLWRGLFAASGDDLFLRSSDRLWPLHPFTDMYGTMVWEPDPSFRLVGDNDYLLADTLEGAGGFAASPVYHLVVPSGSYTFATSRPYLLRGRPARLEVAATFVAPSLYGNDLPSLRSLQVFADGAAVDSIDFGTARDAGVRFQVTGGDTLSLAVRPLGGAEWMPLAVQRDGDGFLARLPADLSGTAALRLQAATNGAGSTLTETWDRAFVARAAPRLEFEPLEATARVGVVRVVWRARAGAGLHLGIERREAGGSWAARDTATADAAGSVVCRDSAVLAGHTYGYRVVRSVAGAPSASGEVWISVPATAELALAGARPNPCPAGHMVVDFSLASSTPARLALYDVAGREVAAADVGALGPGRHLLRLEPWGEQAPGIYFLRLSQGGRNLDRRVCLLR